MKILYLIPVIVSLVACATPDSLRSSAADSIFNSPKPSKKVALCIAEKWEVHPTGTMRVTLRERENGYTAFIVCGGGNACVLADIADTASGSTTEVRTRALGTSGYIREAQECQ